MDTHSAGLFHGKVAAQRARQALHPALEGGGEFLRAYLDVADHYQGVSAEAGSKYVADAPNREAEDEQAQKSFEIPGPNAVSEELKHTDPPLKPLNLPAFRRGAAY